MARNPPVLFGACVEALKVHEAAKTGSRYILHHLSLRIRRRQSAAPARRDLQHSLARLDHQGRPQDSTRRLGIRMLAQILLQHDFVNESRVPVPVVFIERRRQRKMKCEIRMLRLELAKSLVKISCRERAPYQ